MTHDSSSLDALRREIDRIDDRIHDLIMERAALVAGIAAAKPTAGVALRPAREAQIIRRLASRHGGPFPLRALVRIWREMMGALVGLQRPFSAAVYQPARGAGYIELARNHFGVSWPMSILPSPGQVVRQVADGLVPVGIVPLPVESDPDPEPWWLSLTSEAENLPRVVTRLPAVVSDPAHDLQALVIACRPHDPTGDDRTLVAVETVPDVSRDRLRALLVGAGIEPTAMVATHRGEAAWLHLVEVQGYLDRGDARLEALVGSRDPVRHTSVIGGYAAQIGA
ncbi:MAG: chorismate mutase [Solirubrobacterales bacterium]